MISQQDKLKDHLKSRFPIQPYPQQLDLACDIYQSLNNNLKVSIFESPTGTGKSMALIVGGLQYLIDNQLNDDLPFKAQKPPDQDADLPDWFNSYSSSPIKEKVKIPLEKQQDNQEKKPKIVGFEVDYSSGEEEVQKSKRFARRAKAIKIQILYTSRTHSQLQQWVKEVRKFKHCNLTLTTLASRSQLCANKKVLQQAGQSQSKLNHLCRQIDKCPNNILVEQEQQYYDIEDLKQLSCTTCPYYFTKQISESCEVVCLPYQLLLESLDKFENPIVIVDEAHNFGGAMLQMKSTSISYSMIKIVLKGLQTYREKYHQRVKAKTLYYITHLVGLCSGLEGQLSEMHSSSEPTIQLVIVDFLVKLNCSDLELPKLMKFLMNHDMKRRMSGFIDSSQSQQFASFDHFCSFLVSLIIGSKKESVLYFEFSPDIQQSQLKISAVSNLKQFFPQNYHSLFSKLLSKVRNLVLIGGTMQPLSELSVLQTLVPDKGHFIFKNYPHIIAKERCELKIVTKFNYIVYLNSYPKRICFSLAEKKENEGYLLDSTFQLIEDLCGVVPKGLVFFLQSYQMLGKVEI